MKTAFLQTRLIELVIPQFGFPYLTILVIALRKQWWWYQTDCNKFLLASVSQQAMESLNCFIKKHARNHGTNSQSQVTGGAVKTLSMILRKVDVQLQISLENGWVQFATEYIKMPDPVKKLYRKWNVLHESFEEKLRALWNWKLYDDKGKVNQQIPDQFKSKSTSR